MKFGEWLRRAGGPSLEDLEDWAKTAQTGSETNPLKGNPEMSTLERLRVLTKETREYGLTMAQVHVEEVEKLLAVVEAAQEAEDEHLVYSKKLADALKALHEEPK